MRISDWSSDVCSSDLRPAALAAAAAGHGVELRLPPASDRARRLPVRRRAAAPAVAVATVAAVARRRRAANGARVPQLRAAGALRPAVRSEEHTSELQSLMRISYAVFCLKKKKRNYRLYNTTHDE